MKRLALILACCAALAVPAFSAGVASAQIIPQPTNPVPPPPPPPAPPPPRLDVPAVPKMDAPPPRPRVDQRRSFNDRIGDCLTDATAAGLRHAERVAYSRACANQL